VIFGWFDNSEKGDVSELLRACRDDPAVLLRLKKTVSGMLQTTAYLLLGHMAPI